MTSRTLVAIVLTAAASPAFAQGRVTSATSETRQVSQSLEREVNTLAGRKTTLWFAYRMTTPPNARHMCGGSHVALESSTQVTVMGRLESGELQRLRVFTPECDIDTGTVPVVWLEGVTPDQSATWLTAFVREKDKDRNWRSRIANPALDALTLNAGDAAVRSLIALAKDDERGDVRSRALSALGQRAGQQVAATILNAVDRDPETDVKRTAVAALSRMPADEGIPLLIQVARTNTNNEVRREAMLRLGQSNDPRAVRFFEEILTR